MMSSAFRYPIIAFLAVFFISCGRGKDEFEVGSSVHSSNTIVFKPGIPSPLEIFEFTKEVGVTSPDDTNLNSPLNEVGYFSEQARLLNFGTFCADYMYCSVFGLSQCAASYFEICKRMGESLGIAYNLTSKSRNILGTVESNNDLVDFNSHELYLASYDHLHQNDRGEHLCLMLAGNFIESLYLTSMLVKNLDSEQELALSLLDHHLVLEHLIEFIKEHESNEVVIAVLGELVQLDALMSQIESSLNSSMSEASFEKFKSEISKLRTKYVYEN